MTSLRFAACLMCMTMTAAEPAVPATLLVTSPQIEICVTSEDAKYTYSWGVLSPQAGLFSYSPIGQAPLAPQVTAPQEGFPGCLLNIQVSVPESADLVSAQLLGPKQRVLSRGIGFRPDPRQDQWVVLVGVSDVTAHGSYTLSLTVRAGARSAIYLAPVSISERTFRFEGIPMTANLEQLKVEDPRKTAEARELIHIITTSDPDAVFDTGTIQNPLPGARRTSGYGDRRKYEYPDKTFDYSVHEGLDLAAPQGTPVPACGRGRVVFAGPRIITGNTVVVEMLPGLFALYFHLSQIDVEQGEIVGQGDIIGKVGMTGFATGPHLHWEISALGVPVDPDALTAGPILDKTVESGEIDTRKSPKGGE